MPAGLTDALFTVSLDSINGVGLQALDNPLVTPQSIVMGASPDPISAWFLQRIDTTDFYRVVNAMRQTAITISGNLTESSVALAPQLPPNSGFKEVSQEWFLKAAQNSNRAPSYQIVSLVLNKALEYGEDVYGPGFTVATAPPDGVDTSGESTYWTFVPFYAVSNLAPTLQASSSVAPGGTSFHVNVSFSPSASSGGVYQCTIAGNAPTPSVTPNLMSFLTIGDQGMGFSYFAPTNQLGPVGTPVTIMLEDSNQIVFAIAQAIVRG